jgi:membrane fusion protein (multidrug efflux system)
MSRLSRHHFLCLRRSILGSTIPLLFFLAGCGKKQAAAPPPPPEVEVVAVEQRDVPIYREWVANLDGYVNAEIAPQVSGYLIRQDYKEGSLVRKGDVLFEIDPRPFQAALAGAKGQLAQAEAGLAKTTMDVERDTPLAAQSAIPQAQLDNDIQAKAAAKAMVDAAQAQVQQAELNLGWTKVRSLVDGIAGLSKGQVGDLVGPAVVLTTVSQADPIKVYFALSDQEYIKVAPQVSEAALGKLSPQELRKKASLELILSDNSVFPTKGWLEIVDRQVDLRTGTIRLAGAFDNPGQILRPGQFARVRIATGVAKGALLVPQRSVVEIQGTYQVVVVDKDSKAEIRPVKVGERVGQQWIVTQGVKPGEHIVVEGVQKARAGTPVSSKPWTPPAEGQ